MKNFIMMTYFGTYGERTFNKIGICYFYKEYAAGDRNLVPIPY